MLVKPVDAGILRRAAKQLLPRELTHEMNDHELAAHIARSRQLILVRWRAEAVKGRRRR